MENFNTKEFVIEDNDFLIHNGVLTKKEWHEIIAGTLSLLKKEIIIIQNTDIFTQSDNDYLKYIAYNSTPSLRIADPIGAITPTFMGDYLKIEYLSKLKRESRLNINSPCISITTVHDKTNGKLIGGCHVKITEYGKTLGEIYIDLTTEQISGDIILKLGDIKDDILLEYTPLKSKNTETSETTSIILSSIGVKYNGSLNNQIRDTVYNYSTVIVSKLNKFLSETERNYADYFIANDPLNVMLDKIDDMPDV
jgi:hypothetical protein